MSWTSKAGPARLHGLGKNNRAREFPVPGSGLPCCPTVRTGESAEWDAWSEGSKIINLYPGVRQVLGTGEGQLLSCVVSAGTWLIWSSCGV
ncbi:hypothetical protein PoB_007592700 [Plakobranchus ocellatus]|uniref:Uncharacterized protein n=1 Tax=Plakobranchus ocellatus TaxID=259542 RepID=A0AAV4DYM2_9GAST|nr:hypothetical protein PoB_007592700 [Plakobranchus ocellatus]